MFNRFYSTTSERYTWALIIDRLYVFDYLDKYMMYLTI